MERHLVTIIMAAGKGTRMNDPSKAKVMYEVLGKPMIHYVLDVAFAIGSERVLTVVGYQRDTVIQYVRHSHPKAEIVTQAEQRGTGHAVMQTKPVLNGFSGDIVVLSGDVPLLRQESLVRLIQYHREMNAVGTILTAHVVDPTGYGRIVRAPDGRVQKIVEQKDATEEERAICEINSGIYVFQSAPLFEALETLRPNNVQKEYYLTDVFGYFSDHRYQIAALPTKDEFEIFGVNTPEQLDTVRNIVESRLNSN
ncbi:MAG: sugar phosphate nucleotidyltransferase [Bacteroidetes bacterium]|nr:sugar phosphate nucleotidyltransferase [Bacteroidota bacterium]